MTTCVINALLMQQNHIQTADTSSVFTFSPLVPSMEITNKIMKRMRYCLTQMPWNLVSSVKNLMMISKCTGVMIMS